MFVKKLEVIFLGVIVIALLVLGKNYYDSYTFKNNDIPQEYKDRIKHKEQEILINMQRNYGFVKQFPLIVTDKFKGRLYGLTSYNKGQINIYLNKKVMQESINYMIDSVIAHEYAHALMFKLGKYRSKGDGHSKDWQRMCVKLGGKDCQQYVDREEIILSKMPF